MKIVAGLGTIEDYEAYAEAGADELFIGYVPYNWQKNYELAMPLNRREVSFVNVNVGSQSEMEILAKKVDKYKIPVTIAINALNYNPKLYPEIINIVEECKEYGFERFIVADMGLLLALQSYFEVDSKIKNSRIKIHASGEIGEMNSYLISMLRELGVNRIIYHRGARLKDIKSMIEKNPDMEHEVFYMNENCHFTGGYCNSIHCDELIPMCKMPYCTDLKSENEYGLHNSDDYCFYKENSIIRHVSNLSQIGVTHIKIVGRGASDDRMIECIKSARKEIEGCQR